MKKTSLESFRPLLLLLLASGYLYHYADGAVAVFAGEQYRDFVLDEDGTTGTSTMRRTITSTSSSRRISTGKSSIISGWRIRSSTLPLVAISKKTNGKQLPQQENKNITRILHVSFYTRYDCPTSADDRGKMELSNNAILFSSFQEILDTPSEAAFSSGMITASSWNIPTVIDQQGGQPWNLGYEYPDQKNSIMIKCVRIDLDIGTPTDEVASNLRKSGWQQIKKKNEEFLTHNLLIDAKTWSSVVSTRTDELHQLVQQHAQQQQGEWKEIYMVNGLKHGENIINLIPTCLQGPGNLWGDGICQISMNNRNCSYDGGDCSAEKNAAEMGTFSLFAIAMTISVVGVICLFVALCICNARSNSSASSLAPGVALPRISSVGQSSSGEAMPSLSEFLEENRNEIILSNLIQTVS